MSADAAARGPAGMAVLVVDDDPAIRRMISRILTRAGHTCTEAADVGEALRCVAAEEFALVLCDVHMPGGSGLGFLRQLRDQGRDTAVVMVSGLGDLDVAAAAAELGAYGYVVKPFEASQLVITAANALRRRELEMENRAYRQHLEALVDRRTADLQAAVARLSATQAELRLSQEEVIRRLAYAAEFRDPMTGAHLSRMSQVCWILAQRAGLGEERAELVRLASPMHDIGKIGISDAILHSPRPLTDEEVRQMREHPLIGSSILAGATSELLQLGGLIALTHHERWDGQGYPRGLAGEAIPLEGRIAAIADVFDALTSERPYKAAFPIPRAVAMMVEQAGSQFDPALIELFTASLDELTAHAGGPQP